MNETFSKETISLHQTAGGTTYEIDIFRYTHPKAEKTVYLQGGLHGIELSGIPVAYEFMKEIEDRQIPYNFIVVPMSNPMGLDSQIMGLQTGYNNIHTNPQNCRNWNRVGQLRGDGSQEGNWIGSLLTLAEEADIILDLHTAGWQAVPHIYAHSSQIEYVKHLGIPHVMSWEKASNSFSDTCFTLGKIAITFELSSSRVVNDGIVQNSLDYLRRFFHLLPPEDKSQIWQIGKQLKKWYSPKSGVLCWGKKPGDQVKEGDVLASLYSRNGKFALRSPFTGTILLNYPIHAPQEGQELAKFLVS